MILEFFSFSKHTHKDIRLVIFFSLKFLNVNDDKLIVLSNNFDPLIVD